MICIQLYIMRFALVFLKIMDKQNSLFGWQRVFKNYSFEDILEDVTIPFTISSFICLCTLFSDESMYNITISFIDLAVSIVPIMVTLIVAAYTIMLSFIMGEKTSVMKSTDEGKQLIQKLNSSFAVSLAISIFTVIVSVVCKCIALMNIPCLYADIVNYFISFIVCFLLLFCIYILYGIVIDIFNSGQTALL